MNRTTLAALMLVAASSSTSAQDALTFTVSGTQSTLSGSGSSLRIITPTDVAIVTPNIDAYSAEALAVHLNIATLAGDGDGDGFHPEFPVAPVLDALQRYPLDESGPSIRELFFSTFQDLACAGGGVIEPGDVSAIAIGATEDGMIDDAQIRTALGIPTSTTTINVDAITRADSGALFLSFEDGVPLLGGTEWLDDGGVAAIPAAAISWAGPAVASVSADSGVIVFQEAEVDAMCSNADLANHAGGPVFGIGDVDGLEIDPNGGTFTAGDAPWTFPNLVFCGELLTGGGILSTAGDGSIAVINGVAMGTTFEYGATDGTQVGLAAGFKSSLNGLALGEPISRFVLDTKTPYLPSPGTVHFAAGGATPGLYVTWLVTIFGVSTPGGFQPSLSFDNPGFPEWFMSTDSLAGIVADADGVAEAYVPYGGGVPAGVTLVLQGVKAIDGSPALSAPITLQF